jgi:POT family proton-dependent oligopeptide transporter
MIFSRIKNQQHSTEILPFLFSKLFERAAYYGLLSFLFIYIYRSNNTAITIEQTREYYTWFLNSMFITMLLGGILGDLIIGNKKSMLIGGVLMSLGIFLLSNHNLSYFQLGFILLGIGNGLYSPNLLAGLLKHYSNKEKLLDASIIMTFLAINLGGFIAPIIINIRQNDGDYSQGFIISGTLMLISTIISYFVKEANVPTRKTSSISSQINILYLSFFMLSIGIFWYFTQTFFFFINSIKITQLNKQTNFVSDALSDFVLLTLPQLLTILFAFILAMTFTFLYIKRFSKIIFGFVLTILSFIILLNLPETIGEENLSLIAISIFLFSVAELFIIPTLYALISKFGYAKYYAILFALIYLPFNLINIISNFKIIDSSKIINRKMAYSIGAFAILILIFIVINWFDKRKINSQNL